MKFDGKPVLAKDEDWIEVEGDEGGVVRLRGYNEALVEYEPSDTDPDAEFRAAIEAATSIADLKAALLGAKGPGAEPRRPA